jgi:hypothetical protein
MQRVGLSATVGNPGELLAWLQGSFRTRDTTVIAHYATATAAEPEIAVDYVGSIANAAKVIASLHFGEKRLVFVDSRRQAEELGAGLREHGIETYISHSSLSAQERRRSENRIRRSPRHGDRRDFDTRAGRRRRRLRSGHPDRFDPDCRLVPAATGAHRPARRQHSELFIPMHRRRIRPARCGHAESMV